MARKEKQRQKMERRLERKQNRGLPGAEGAEGDADPNLVPEGEPVASDEPTAAPDAEADGPAHPD